MKIIFSLKGASLKIGGLLGNVLRLERSANIAKFDSIAKRVRSCKSKARTRMLLSPDAA